jgi:hypothetical protein
MIELRFRGWFQCRLATDPDPYDEPRGVSGYVNAYVDEPDLDRIIHLQPPAFRRDHAPPVGVQVDQLLHDGQEVASSPLIGAAVTLLGAPRFEGRNKVIAGDGLEPVYPFDLAITTGPFQLRRAVLPADPAFPYDGLYAHGVEGALDVIQAATGIVSLIPVWQQRLADLRTEEATAAEPHKTALRERIGFLQRNLAAPRGGVAGFFGALMRYDYELAAAATLEDPAQLLPEDPATGMSWRARFWLGAWDADALCGYCRGSLTLPAAGDERLSLRELHRIGRQIALG